MSKKRHSSKNNFFSSIHLGIRVVRAVVLVVVTFSLFGVSLVAGVGLGYFNSLVASTKIPDKNQLKKRMEDVEEVSNLAYADGSSFSTIKSDLRRTTVLSGDIASIMKQAVVATEDEYFYEHKGIVPKAVLRALLGDALGIGGSSGGSTLTQQLVKQQILGDDPTFKRKANEIDYAQDIEKYFTKDEILTMYLNVSPFGRNNKGENIAGVQEAAQGIFGVSAKELNIAQAAFLAGLPQSPIVYSPFEASGHIKEDENLSWGLQRQKNVLFNMYRAGYINEKQYEEALKFDLKAHFKSYEQSESTKNGFLYYSVLDAATDILARKNAKEEKVSDEELEDLEVYAGFYNNASRELRQGGYKVTSTIRKDIYDAMQEASANYGYMLDNGIGVGVETGEVLMENQTGAVLGFVGSRDFNMNQNNHAFDTERSPGSTIKPLLVYGPAIDKGLIGTESQISNFATKYETNGQSILHNGTSGTGRYMSVREAIEWSWNIPAYWTYRTLLDGGYEPNKYMEEMGFTIKDYNIESLPMGGGAEVSVIQQTNGFQTLANHGEYQKGYLIEKIEDTDGQVIYQHEGQGKQVYSHASASIMNDLLRSVIDSGTTTKFKVMMQSEVNQGLASADWIGKTGTSDEFRDGWLIVSTPKVTLGSWSGFDDNSPMNLNIADNNSRYLAYMANVIYQTDPSVFGVEERFDLDPSVIKNKVSSFTGEKPGIVDVNGKKINTKSLKTIKSNEIESYWAQNGAPDSAYEFGIGGTRDNYKTAWSRPDYRGSDPFAQDALNGN